MWSIKAQSLCQFLQLTQSERIFERAIYCTVDERYLSFFDKDNLLSGVIVSSFPTSYTPDPSTVVLADFKGSLIVHGERQEARREYLTEDFTSSCFLFCLFLLYTSYGFLSLIPGSTYCFLPSLLRPYYFKLLRCFICIAQIEQ